MLALLKQKKNQMLADYSIYERNMALQRSAINDKWMFVQDPVTFKWSWQVLYLNTRVKTQSVNDFPNIQACVQDAYEHGYPKAGVDLMFRQGYKFLLEIEVVECDGDLITSKGDHFKINLLAPIPKNKTNKKVRK